MPKSTHQVRGCRGTGDRPRRFARPSRKARHRTAYRRGGCLATRQQRAHRCSDDSGPTPGDCTRVCLHTTNNHCKRSICWRLYKQILPENYITVNRTQQASILSFYIKIRILESSQQLTQCLNGDKSAPVFRMPCGVAIITRRMCMYTTVWSLTC